MILLQRRFGMAPAQAPASRRRGTRCAFRKLIVAERPEDDDDIPPSKANYKPQPQPPAEDAYAELPREVYYSSIQRLNRIFYTRISAMTTDELRELIFDKWKAHYSTDITVVNAQDVRLQILSDKRAAADTEEYRQRLKDVVDVINEWGVANVVRQEIAKSTERMRGSGGSIQIPLRMHFHVSADADADAE